MVGGADDEDSSTSESSDLSKITDDFNILVN